MYFEPATLLHPVIAAIFMATLLSCNSTKTSSKVVNESKPVTISVNYTSDYCGGANPPEQIIQSLKVPKPMINANLLISKEKTISSEVMNVKTSDKGIFTAELTEDEYFIFLPEKNMGNSISSRPTIDSPNCKKWQATPNGRFKITKGDKSLTVEIHKTCNPCIEPPR